ncbi:MAG: hypothetical protein HYY18_17120 [Planctomycetes bacterium]|nr:hypothetical protein [Planctomycetota bacterium]
MKVNYLIACDGVVRTQGKLNVLGIFTVITVRKVPCVHPYLALVAELNAEPGEHEFLFRFRGSGDEDLTPATPVGKFRVDDVGVGEVVAELRNFPIVKAGFLAIQLVIDGRVAGQRDLIVRSVEI